MAHFSNGEEGRRYQAEYCFNCRYWNETEKPDGEPGPGCPIWFLHELHVGEAEWQPLLDRLIPMEPKILNPIPYTYTFPGECVAYWPQR